MYKIPIYIYMLAEEKHDRMSDEDLKHKNILCKQKSLWRK